MPRRVRSLVCGVLNQNEKKSLQIKRYILCDYVWPFLVSISKEYEISASFHTCFLSLKHSIDGPAHQWKIERIKSIFECNLLRIVQFVTLTKNVFSTLLGKKQKMNWEEDKRLAREQWNHIFLSFFSVFSSLLFPFDILSFSFIF